jgi:hypothetical protein
MHPLIVDLAKKYKIQCAEPDTISDVKDVKELHLFSVGSPCQ